MISIRAMLRIPFAWPWIAESILDAHTTERAAEHFTNGASFDQEERSRRKRNHQQEFRQAADTKIVRDDSSRHGGSRASGCGGESGDQLAEHSCESDVQHSTRGQLSDDAAYALDRADRG